MILKFEGIIGLQCMIGDVSSQGMTDSHSTLNFDEHNTIRIKCHQPGSYCYFYSFSKQDVITHQSSRTRSKLRSSSRWRFRRISFLE